MEGRKLPFGYCYLFNASPYKVNQGPAPGEMEVIHEDVKRSGFLIEKRANAFFVIYENEKEIQLEQFSLNKPPKGETNFYLMNFKSDNGSIYPKAVYGDELPELLFSNVYGPLTLFAPMDLWIDTKDKEGRVIHQLHLVTGENQIVVLLLWGGKEYLFLVE
ncbi:hypothetical protein [Thalassobacillus hwangdonensis]|uniref:Uncharacterized protein n=1 Tax=Thalassobacillus hwangdonensis TaxID=546108 RepID=A0ABW3KWD9_9BACI